MARTIEDMVEAIQASRRGDTRAFGALLEMWAPLVVRLLRLRLPSSSAIEALAEEIFLSAWHDLERLRDPLLFPAQLLARVHRLVDGRYAEECREAELEEWFAELPRSERADARAQGWTWQQREVFRRRYLLGQSQAEIGTRLGIPPARVSLALRQIKARIRLRPARAGLEP